MVFAGTKASEIKEDSQEPSSGGKRKDKKKDKKAKKEKKEKKDKKEKKK